MNKKGCSLTIGSGFLGTLSLILITLKLIGKINWSWLEVLLPAFLPAIILSIMIALYLILDLIVTVGKKKTIKYLKRKKAAS